MLDDVRRTYPAEKVRHVFVSRGAHQPHQFWLGEGDLRVAVEPRSGRILGAWRASASWLGWLAELHIRLLRGENGHTVVGISGVALFGLGATGLVLWWPGIGRAAGARWRQAFKPRWRTNWKGRNHELHRVGGVLVSGLLMLTALSGVALVWPDSASALLNRLTGSATPQKPRVPKRVTGATQQTPALDVLVRNALAAMPDGVLSRISFPAKAGAPLMIRKKLAAELHPNGANYIYLDPVSGRVLRVERSDAASPTARWMNLRYPLHIGRWGGDGAAGLFVRGLYVLLGLMPAALFGSGFVMWWHHLRRRLGSRAPRVTPSS